MFEQLAGVVRGGDSARVTCTPTFSAASMAVVLDDCPADRPVMGALHVLRGMWALR